MSSKDHTYRIPGGKTGVLLVHGLCGTPTEMRYVANGLARAGYTVLCPQLAGHCGSAEDIKNTSWQDWYKSCEAGLDELRLTCDTVIVGGLSTGALLALVLAAEHPDKVQGVTLYAPVLWLNGWLIPWYARLFRIIGNKTLANMIPFPDLHPHGIKDDRIREFILSALNSGDSSVAGLPSTPGGAVLEHRWLSDAVRGMVPSIKQPVLILHPREDDYADLNNAHYLQRNLPGSVEMVVLEDSYHIITVDRQRDVVVEKSVSFVEGVLRQLAKPVRKVAKVAAKAAAPARAAPAFKPAMAA
jgi:carboxylesterase